MSTDLSIFIQCRLYSGHIGSLFPLFGDETNGGSHEGTRTFSTVDPKAH
jgi:hypothetical protein